MLHKTHCVLLFYPRAAGWTAARVTRMRTNAVFTLSRAFAVRRVVRQGRQQCLRYLKLSLREVSGEGG